MYIQIYIYVYIWDARVGCRRRSAANKNSPEKNTGGRTNTSASRYNHTLLVTPTSCKGQAAQPVWTGVDCKIPRKENSTIFWKFMRAGSFTFYPV